GIDFTADWRTDMAKGKFGVNFMISTLIDEKTQDTARAPVVDWKGSLGPSASTSLNNGAYDYRTFTTVSYGRGEWNLSLRWRHLRSAIDATQAAINASINAGLQKPGTLSTSLGAESSYDIFDLSGGFNVGKRTELHCGIEHLAE